MRIHFYRCTQKENGNKRICKEREQEREREREREREERGERERERESKNAQVQMALNITCCQWWSVTKYNYFVTVLKYIFQVSVLYWSSLF